MGLAGAVVEHSGREGNQRSNFVVVFGSGGAHDEGRRGSNRVRDDVHLLVLRVVYDVIDDGGNIVEAHFVKAATFENVPFYSVCEEAVWEMIQKVPEVPKFRTFDRQT